MITGIPGPGAQNFPSKNAEVLVYTVNTGSHQLHTNYPVKLALLKADDDNSGSIYICINEESCAPGKGIRLIKSQAITLEISNLNMLYVSADTDGQLLYVVVLK